MQAWASAGRTYIRTVGANAGRLPSDEFQKSLHPHIKAFRAQEESRIGRHERAMSDAPNPSCNPHVTTSQAHTALTTAWPAEAARP